MNFYEIGQTIDLGPYELRDSNNVLVNATSTTCTVRRPDATTATVTLTNVSTGIYTGRLTLTAAGTWTAEARLSVGSNVATNVESWEVLDSPVTAPFSDLILIDQLETSVGSKVDEVRASWAIRDASAAIRTYTERSFAIASATTTKSYRYDGTWLTIDDATAVTGVAINGVAVTAGFDYVLGPDRGFQTPDASVPVYEWIELSDRVDRLSHELPGISTIAVTGTFGWPTVPADVQRACLYVAASFYESPRPYVSQSVDTYSVTVPQAARDAIPERAKELLAPYRRMTL